MRERCNCENMACERLSSHRAGACPNTAGASRALYVGAICDCCAAQTPCKFLLRPGEEIPPGPGEPEPETDPPQPKLYEPPLVELTLTLLLDIDQEMPPTLGVALTERLNRWSDGRQRFSVELLSRGLTETVALALCDTRPGNDEPRVTVCGRMRAKLKALKEEPGR